MATLDTFEFFADDQTRRPWLWKAIENWSHPTDPKADVAPFGAFLQAQETLGDLVARLLAFIREKYTDNDAIQVFDKLDQDLAEFVSEDRHFMNRSIQQLITAVSIACQNKMSSFLEPLRNIISGRKSFLNEQAGLKVACTEALTAKFSGEEIFALADTVLMTNFGSENSSIVPVSYDCALRNLPSKPSEARFDAVVNYTSKVVGKLREFVHTSLASGNDSNADDSVLKMEVLKIVVSKNFDDQNLWEHISQKILSFTDLERITDEWFEDETPSSNDGGDRVVYS